MVKYLDLKGIMAYSSFEQTIRAPAEAQNDQAKRRVMAGQ